jgi:hypothetical protein
MDAKTLIATLMAYLEAFKLEVSTHWAWLDESQWRAVAGTAEDRGQVSTLVTVVTIGIVAIIGVLIFDEVLNSTFTGVDNDIANNTRLENSSSEVAGGFGDALDLIPVVLLVLVASLVIAVVQQF